MRIVHILTRLLRAGSEENTLLTTAGQLAAGHEVIVIHGHEAMPQYAAKIAPGVELVASPALTRELDPRRDAAAFTDIKHRLMALRADVVHTHQSKAGILGRFAAAAAGVPLIVHGVHILPFIGVGAVERTFYLGAERAAARVTNAFIHVSDGMRQACLRHRVGWDRSHYVVPSGFDLRRFAEAKAPEDWRDLLGIGHDEDKPVVIAMLAAFEPRKRHLDLLRHLRDFLRNFPQVRIVFAGEGRLKREIEATIARFGLGRQVSLLGFREDPEQIIAMADICIHCSEREGLPRSVLQYVVARRPVVMFCLPGIEEVVTDGSNGSVVAQEDWEAFLKALAALVGDPAARAAMARNARNVRLDRWEVSFMATRTLAIYREVMSSCDAGRVAA